MKDDNSPKEGKPLLPDSGRAFAARRTIVKGMASAVPVVMTIGCGQALAQASNLQCIEKEGLWSTTETPVECLTGTDNYIREPDTAGQCPDGLTATNGFGARFGSKGARTLDSSSSLSGTSSSTESTTVYGGVAGKGDRKIGNQLDARAVTQNRLVFLDSFGNRTSKANGYAVTMSCYASFMPT